MIFGSGNFHYRVVEGWGQGADGRAFGGVIPSVAVDSQDRVYLARRTPAAILVYDRDGRFLSEWGANILHSPHSVWISAQDELYIADMEDHTVRRFTTSGQLLQTWGTNGQPGAPGMPFNKPTWAVATPTGELFVSDGYGQFRIHRFGADGALLRSWGEQGPGPGQFGLPHGIRIDSRGRVLLMDREPNHRIQLFDMDGEFLSEWPGLAGPNDGFIDADDHILVAESGYRISVLNLDGELLARWGEQGDTPGQFANAPHGIWADSHGDLYVTEVPYLPDRVQKFARL
jgi:DNA-binding beta-propeller fold protein YncE